MKTETNATLKSPLKEPPLHVPGQSLDEEINRVMDEDVSGWIAIIVIAIIVTVFEWIRYFLSIQTQQAYFTIVTIVVVSYGIYRLLQYKKRIARLKQGRDGEREVGQQLEVLRTKGCIIFHDIVGNDFNVDHVVISTKGIFSVETKTIGKVPGINEKVIYRDGTLHIGGHIPESNPVEQANAQASWIRNILLESTGKTFPVKSVVLYPGWFVEPMSPTDKKTIWILNPKAFPAFVEKTDVVLNEEDVRLAAYHLGKHIRASYK